MTKEEFIEKYWKLYGIPVSKKYMDENGYLLQDKGPDMPDFIVDFYSQVRYRYNKKRFQFERQGFRPIELQGLEQNAGWTKHIDENTWPTRKDLWYDVCKFHPEEDNPSEPLKIHRRMTALEVIHLCNDGIITHWREHKEELKPKY